MPDASDRRAKLIVLTDLGYEALQDAFDTIIGMKLTSRSSSAATDWCSSDGS